MITYNSRFLTRGEIWFDEEPDHRGLDWLLYNQRSRPVPGAKWKYFHSLLLDLAGPDELLAQMNKDTVYKIRRARDKDKVICAVCGSRDAAALDAFEEMYNRFAAVKGLSPLERPRLNSLAATGNLDLSVAKDAHDAPLVYHAYYRNSHRTTLLFSASRFRELADSAARNAIGRANRYLFWTDMLRSKELGLEYFDFGGWYPGTTDAGLLKINEFKKGFGGRVVREYQCEQILSLRGWVVLRAAALLQQCRSLTRREHSEAPDSPLPVPELKTNTNA